MLPTHECFIRDDRSVRQTNDGLIGEPQFVVLDRSAQIGGELQPPHGTFVHGMIEEGCACAAFGFRAIHRGIRIAQQLFRVRIPRRQRRDADRSGRVDSTAIDIKRLGDALLNQRDAACQIRDMRELSEEHRKFISPESRNGIVRACKTLEAFRDRA